MIQDPSLQCPLSSTWKGELSIYSIICSHSPLYVQGCDQAEGWAWQGAEVRHWEPQVAREKERKGAEGKFRLVPFTVILHIFISFITNFIILIFIMIMYLFILLNFLIHVLIRALCMGWVSGLPSPAPGQDRTAQRGDKEGQTSTTIQVKAWKTS